MVKGKKGTGPRAGATAPSCPRASKSRHHKTPRAAAKKRQKREREGSGSRSEFRVRCCLSLMGTPAERPRPCWYCRKARYHVPYDADPDNGRVTTRRRNGKTYKEYNGHYCAKPPTGVEFRDRAGDETTYCDRVVHAHFFR